MNPPVSTIRLPNSRVAVDVRSRSLVRIHCFILVAVDVRSRSQRCRIRLLTSSATPLYEGPTPC